MTLNFSFRIITWELIFLHGHRLVLTITQQRVITSARILLNFSEGQWDTSMPESQQLVNSVDLPLRNRMQPIIPAFAWKDHQWSWLNIKVNSLIRGVFEMHNWAALKTDSAKHFLEGWVRINVRWDALARHVVICSHLIKVPKPCLNIICAGLVLPLYFLACISNFIHWIAHLEVWHYFLDSWL